jgi:beta-glucosidase
MTLEEKIGQMTQITLDVISNPAIDNKAHQLNAEKLKEAILKYHVGSILNVADDKAFTLPHWHEVITTIQNEAFKDRLKIPVLYGIDSIHGAHYTKGATLFPQSINLAATWTPAFNAEVGRITALETRASGIPWNFFPVLDIGRQFLWSRLFETYGEDLYLSESMSRANIMGQQGDDISVNTHVAACMKHFLGYSYPTSGKDKTPAIISERMMREYFLPPFSAAVDAGAETVMLNTGEIDGIPGHVNYHLITEVLKGELHFLGFAVSDWLDIKKLFERDHMAKTEEEAVKMAIMAGVDMSMVPYDYSFIKILTKLVKKKQVPMSRIDDAVARILRVKFKLGLFENAYPDKTLTSQFASLESEKINQHIASESITLLKNENNILPFEKGKKILVTGPTGNNLTSLNGGWTLSWQGDNEELYPKNKKTVFKALEDSLGHDKVRYIKGINLSAKNDDYEQALKAALESDIILLCLGEKTYTEVPGNIDDLTLDKVQLQFARDLYKIGKPVVLLLLEGRPRLISEIEKEAAAIVMGYLPGMEGAQAIADILTGVINPSGKLPYSYPRQPNDLLHYDHKYQEISEGKIFNPQWPFGFGLSYTTFEYGHLELSQKVMHVSDELIITVDVKNTGVTTGQEVVQLYLSDLYRHSVTPPVKQLKGFQKISLAPHETKKVTFKINLKDLSFIGREDKRIAEKGLFNIQISQLQGQFELK